MRYMVIHSGTQVIDLADEKGGAHCFGPYESFEAAVAADRQAADACYKVALPIVGPEAVDVDAMIALEATHGHDVPPPEGVM